MQVESECQCEREKRAQAVAKETKEVCGAASFFMQTSFSMRMQMEARLTKAEKEEIARMKVRSCFVFAFPFCLLCLLAQDMSRSRVLQKSSWDDWKDDNPAGSGNTGANLG